MNSNPKFYVKRPVLVEWMGTYQSMRERLLNALCCCLVVQNDNLGKTAIFIVIAWMLAFTSRTITPSALSRQSGCVGSNDINKLADAGRMIKKMLLEMQRRIDSLAAPEQEATLQGR